MTDEVKHTPLPWRAMHWGGGSEVFGGNGEAVVRTSGGYRSAKEQARVQEDVELIVRAANAHADLLAACEALVLHMRSIGTIITREEEPLVQSAEAAIAKAKGGAA